MHTKKTAILRRGGYFYTKISGVSFYQSTLKKIYRSNLYINESMLFDAKLVLEDDNFHDSFAVRVDLDGQTVGHLSKNNAIIYRENLSKAGLTEHTILCPAKIFKYKSKSDDCEVCYSLSIDLPDHYCVGFEEIIADTSSISVSLKFSLDGIDIDVLSLCNKGDRLKLWIPATNPTRIYVYIHLNGPGKARLGHIPKEYFSSIHKHISNNLDYSIHIESISNNSCHVNCFLESKNDTAERIRYEWKSRLLSEISQEPKSFRSFLINVDIPLSNSLHIGQTLTIHTENIDTYLSMHDGLCIKFKDEGGNIAAWIKDKRSDIIKILKMIYHGIDVHLKIESITNLGITDLQHLKHTSARARIKILQPQVITHNLCT